MTSLETVNATVMRRSKPMVRSPGRISSRRVPRSGKCSSRKQYARTRSRIGCCSGLAGPSDKKIEEMVELPLRSRSEDHTHNNSTSVGARLVTSLDPLRDSAAVGHVGGIGLVFLVGRDDLLLQPSIEGVITIPQRPEALADDVAFARVLAALHLGLYHLRHVLREGDAQRTAGRHGRVSQRALLARSFP